jgi:hypothetical protein
MMGSKAPITCLRRVERSARVPPTLAHRRAGPSLHEARQTLVLPPASSASESPNFEILSQLPPGSTTLKPRTVPNFFRDRRMRGMPAMGAKSHCTVPGRARRDEVVASGMASVARLNSPTIEQLSSGAGADRLQHERRQPAGEGGRIVRRHVRPVRQTEAS